MQIPNGFLMCLQLEVLQVWVQVDYKCLEFVATGCCIKKQLRLDQTIKNLTCGDLQIPLVVIQLQVTALKKIKFVYLLDLFGGRKKRVVSISVCGAPLDWANDGSIDVFFTYVYCFISMGSQFYSRSLVWNLETKLCYIASGK